MEDEELTVYINSYRINLLNIPNLGVLEKLTEYYWIMNDEEFIVLVHGKELIGHKDYWTGDFKEEK